MRLDPPSKAASFGVPDVPFTAGIGDCLPKQVDPGAGRQKVRYSLANRGQRKPFLNRDVVRSEIVAVHDNVF